MNVQSPLSAVRPVSDGVFLDNAWIPSVAGETLETFAPGDGRSLANAFGDTQVPAAAQRVVTLYQGATDSAVDWSRRFFPLGLAQND